MIQSDLLLSCYHKLQFLFMLLLENIYFDNIEQLWRQHQMQDYKD